MTVIDTLQILVEADARGIDQVLKNVISTVTGTVNQINKQEVSWTEIFTRSVSPALIGGIASMFAFAIEQSVSFQQSMLKTGTAAGESTNQIAQTSIAALDLSKTIPQSAQDISNAMLQISAIFGKNTEATRTVAEAMGQLSSAGFGNLNDIVAASMDIFKQWGVTTSSSAVSVLTSLMHGAEAARESIPALSQQFSSISPPLIIAGMGLKDFNGVLSTFSATIKDIGGDQAKQMFESIATGASDASSPVAIFGGGVEAIRKSLKDNGGLDTIKKLSDVMSTRFGDNVGLIAKAFGFSAINVEGLILAGKKLPTLSSDSLEVARSTESIKEAWDKSRSSLDELTMAWNEFKANAISSGSIFLPFVTETVKGFDVIVQSAGILAKTISSATTDAVTGLMNLFNSPTMSNLNTSLQKSGVSGMSPSVLSRIDKTASENGLIESLTSALSTGIKGGQYSTLVNTFHLNVPAGSQGLTAKMIAQQLYNQFQGTP